MNGFWHAQVDASVSVRIYGIIVVILKQVHGSDTVVFFAPVDTGISESGSRRFSELVGQCDGRLNELKGLKAIESSISGE